MLSLTFNVLDSTMLLVSFSFFFYLLPRAALSTTHRGHFVYVCTYKYFKTTVTRKHSQAMKSIIKTRLANAIIPLNVGPFKLGWTKVQRL